jgi:hypothetical protein
MFSFISTHPFQLLNSFNRSHCSIFIHEYTVLLQYLPSFALFFFKIGANISIQDTVVQTYCDVYWKMRFPDPLPYLVTGLTYYQGTMHINLKHEHRVSMQMIKSVHLGKA